MKTVAILGLLDYGRNSRGVATAVLIITCITSTVALPTRAIATISHNIRDYVPVGLRDFSVKLKTGKYSQKAGEQISKEFGLLYELSGNGQMHYKQPNSIRFDGKITGVRGVFIMDGFTQSFRVGPIHHNQNESQAPGKITTLLDVGLLNNFYLSYTLARFEGIERVERVSCAKFRLTYQSRLHDTSFRLVWVDPDTRVVLKREEHGQDGVLRAVYTYKTPILVSGVWLPTEIDAINPQGQFVGQTFIQDAQVNIGLSDKLFR